MRAEAFLVSCLGLAAVAGACGEDAGSGTRGRGGASGGDSSSAAGSNSGGSASRGGGGESSDGGSASGESGDGGSASGGSGDGGSASGGSGDGESGDGESGDGESGDGESGDGGSASGGSASGGYGGAAPTYEETKLAEWSGGTHFDVGHAAFAQFDAEGEVPADCATCHSREGFDHFVAQGEDTTEATAPSDALTCTTCHAEVDIGVSSLDEIDVVEFPSGVSVTNDTSDAAFVCIKCHGGREAGSLVDTVIGSGALEPVSVHHAPAAATWFGGQTAGGYQYAGKQYASARVHAGGSSCARCHDASSRPHTFEVRVVGACLGCHSEASVGQAGTLRLTSLDIDGDGDANEALSAELDTLEMALLAAMRAAAAAEGSQIVYAGSVGPYWFIDADEDGVADVAEATADNLYVAWTDALLRAAYNYDYSQRDPGAWAHNVSYMAQLLIDSIDDLGGDVSGFNRPLP